MILKCPNCEINYEIPVDLPPEGRKVRCASCQHVWNATPSDQAKPDISLADFEDAEIVFKNDEEMNPESSSETAPIPAAETPAAETPAAETPAAEAPAAEAPAAEAPAAEPEADTGNSQGSIDDIFAQDLEPEEAPQEPAPAAAADADTGADEDAVAGADAPSADKTDAGEPSEDNFSESAMEEVFSSAVQEASAENTGFSGQITEESEEPESPPIVIGKAKKRRRFVPGNIAAGWAALAIFLAGVTSFSYFERITVVRVLPGAASTYQRLGLPVNVRGLEFDKIKYSWETSGGRQILEVYGDIVNVTSQPLKVPTVVFGLRTKEKVEVYQWAADVRSELLPGGQRTAFSAQIPTPPKSIRDVQVRFAKVR